MTAQPIDADAAPAKWLKAALSPRKRVMTLASGLVIADAIPAVGFAAGLALAVGALPQGISQATPGAALAIASLLARGVLAQCATVVGARAARAVKGDLRRQVLNGAFSGRLSDAETMTATNEGVQALDGHVSRFLPARLAAGVTPLLLILAAAVVSPFTAGILLFTLAPFVIGMALTGMAAGAESRRQFQALERLSGLFLDRIRALPAILAFQAETQQTAVIARASDDLARRTGSVLKIAFLSSAVLEFFSALSVALVAVYCGFNLLKLLPFPAPEQLSLTRAFFLLALAPEVYAPMRRLSAAYHDRQAAEAAVPSLRNLIDAAEATPNRPPVPAGAPAIAFRAVAVAYDVGAPVLTGFDLAVPPGATVALLGPSGSGKSSLLHLFLGLSPLTGGEVEVGGARLSDRPDLTAWIAWAGQAPVVVPGTLAENIGLAWRGAPSERVMEAAARAGFTGGLNRVIDERGGGLSGGERRRLGLARAFLKPAPILLLDEPTANLDAASEAALLPIIRAAAEGRTTLIATHSEAVAELADVVVRL
ncbi:MULTISPECIES: thiol reductant ABC exporter subunit CydD [unclassified Brevundimonas]|uniref:thiol reductant ABC exporter subunit CydD n=1 Tax=unclassified Brevundimonas TaxID=2622653 RepID=UPI003F90C1C7